MINENLNLPLKTMWEAQQFNTPTEVQELTFDPIMKGESFVAISPTGTGKTLAYLIPLLNSMTANNQLQALIIAPSQELAKQISTVAKEWATPLGIKTQLIIGGANFKRQQEAMKDRPELIIATPGRLLELAQKTKKVKFHTVKTVVFDEADYVWHEDNRKAALDLQASLLRDTQYMWFSATFSGELQAMMDASPREIRLIQTEADHKSLNIDHHYVVTNNRQKLAQLKKLANVDGMQALVFFEQVNELQSVASRLQFDGTPIASLHGKLNKLERQRALQQFSQGKLTYLLTTDVASRGLDIPDLPFIIHFNRIADARIYLHRSGRTGRMGKYGQVISLVNEQELRDLEHILKPKNIELTERFIYARELVGAAERQVNRELEEDGWEEVTPRPKSAEKTSSKPVARKEEKAQAPAPVKAKKKNRNRQSKNKGKRRQPKSTHTEE